MPFSTVQREQLVSPLNLALMVGLFAISFVFLKPTSYSTSSSAGQGLEPNLGAAVGLDQLGVSNEVDELGVAYLKARSHTGDVDPEMIIQAVRMLVRDDRHEEAQRLLSDNSDIRISDAVRIEIDMELSANESDESLFAMLQKLNESPAWHTEALMERAVELSKTIEHPQLSYELYSTWAKTSALVAGTAIDIQVSAIYKQCGDHFQSIDEDHRAMSCYTGAIDSLPENYRQFEIKLGMMQSSVTHSEQQNELINELVNDNSLEIEDLKKLASVLLVEQRPEYAYPLYAKLAVMDPDNAGPWYKEAARWAEASTEPREAAKYLEALTAYQTIDEKDDTQVRIEKLLMAAGEADAALVSISERIELKSDDEELLEHGVSIARQTGNSRQAFTWNSMLLELNPNNIVAQQRQSELALAINDLPLALRWYKKSLENDPSNMKTRRRLAEVTEWSGQPYDALKLWQGIASRSTNRSDKVEALKHVVRLSAATIMPDEGADALRQLSTLEAPSDADVLQLVKFYKLNGEPEKAASALQQIEQTHGANDFLLRTLAMHEYEHSEYENSLAAWNRYADSIGYTSDSTIWRTELLWRLDRRDEAAEVVQQLRAQSLLSNTTDYQIRMLAEISWQYRIDWLSNMVQPRLEGIEEKDLRDLHSRRALTTLQDAGEHNKAVDESIKLWGSTGSTDYALMAMQLALKTGNQQVLEQFAPDSPDAIELKSKPEYWTQIAAQRTKLNDNEGALQAYEKGLAINDRHIESVAGLLWLAIAEQNEAQLQKYLKQYESLAKETPVLWQPMAVGYLQLGAASTSVLWFNRLLDQIDSDYSMLLTYADALEYAGRASAARKVRQYALQQLRPLLLVNTSPDQDMLLRHYSRISSRYESIGTNERLIDYLLADESQINSATDSNAVDQLWRQDMAISWLMSTQQHELARVVMADMHEKRLQAPAWQTLALAMKEKDNKAIEAVMASKGTLSIGNHILALRQLGHDREAYTLAQHALKPGAWLFGSGTSDRRIAQDQYVSLRNSRPSYIGGDFSGRSVSGLGISDTGVTIRHTLAQSNLGFSMTLKNRHLQSDDYQLQGNEDIADVSASMYYNTGRHSASLTAGVVNTEKGDETYGRAKLALRSLDQRRGISAELAMNESVELSSELIIAGAQNRATLAFDSSIGRNKFIRLQTELTEIHTRYDQEKVATGVQGIAEIGVQGSFGSNQWTASVQASQIARERVDVLPQSLQLRAGSSLDSVVTEESQMLAVGATLSRGGFGVDYPQVTSPRYYLSANLGNTWPQNTLGLQLDAGAGIRVLGGDELSFSVAHGALQSTRDINDATRLGVNYRYHFQ